MLRQLKSSAAALLFTLGCTWHAPEVEAEVFLFNGSFSQSNDVQVFAFTVDDPGSEVTIETFNLRASSFTNNGQPFGNTGGFDPILTLFNPDGTFLTSVVTDICQDQSDLGCYDSRITEDLDAGEYYFSLAQFDNSFLFDVAGANIITNPLFFRDDQPNYLSDLSENGLGCVGMSFAVITSECTERNSQWAVAIYGDEVTRASIVPLPAALPLLATALAGIGFIGWRRRGAARA